MTKVFSRLQSHSSKNINDYVIEIRLQDEDGDSNIAKEYTFTITDENLRNFNLYQKIQRSHAALKNPILESTLQEYQQYQEKIGDDLHNIVYELAGIDWDTIISDKPTRYSFHIDPQIWSLPWELLRHRQFGFLDSISTPIVRFISSPSPTPISLSPRLHFLGAESLNSRYTAANEQYQTLLGTIPADVPKGGLVEQNYPDTKNRTTQWDRFITDIQNNPPDILHIVAHGIINQNGKYVLVFEGVSRRNDEVIIDCESLFEILLHVKSVKLLILAACQSGKFFEQHPLLAQQLFDQTDLHAAVLFSSDVSVEVMLSFTEHFYEALWSGLDVAQAVTATRSILRASRSLKTCLQWSLPIIYESMPINPFKSLLQDIRAVLESYRPLELEFLESLQRQAVQIHEITSKLVELRNQARFYKASEKIFVYELRRVTQDLFDILRLFDRGNYSPDDQMLIHSLNMLSSEIFPIIEKFALDDNYLSNQGNEALRACYELKARIDHILYLAFL